MANIIEVDLEKNLIIPIPQVGFTKQQLAESVAEHFNYSATKKEVVSKEFTGTKDDFEVLFNAITTRKALIEGQKINETTFKFIYQEEIESPAELTKYEFGLYKASKRIGDLLREIFEAKAKQLVKADIEALEAQAEETADSLKANLEGIKAM